jgi:hypothetical protein
VLFRAGLPLGTNGLALAFNANGLAPNFIDVPMVEALGACVEDPRLGVAATPVGGAVVWLGTGAGEGGTNFVAPGLKLLEFNFRVELLRAVFCSSVGF